MNAPGSIRVVVAEDEEPLRAAICDLIGGEEGLDVVGSAASAAEAIELAAALEPDVAIVDVRMPGGGPEAACGIRARSPATRVVALSAYEDHATVVEMLRCGAVGYLVKGISPIEIVEAIQRAARGQVSLSVDVIAGVVDELASEVSIRSDTVADLRRSEERFRGLLESAPDAVVIVDENGQIVLVNAQTEELFGYARQELLGRPMETLLPERVHEPHEPHLMQWASYIADPTTRPMRVGLGLSGRRRNGSEFPVDISLSAFDTQDGRLATVFVRDITERTRVDDARRKSDERFRALLESAPDAVIITDSDGRIVLVNDQTESLFGYSKNELLGEPVETLLPERFRAKHVGHRAGYLGGPKPRPMGVGLDLAGRRKDGNEFPVDVSLSAIDTEEGRLLTAFVRDITERHGAEEAIKQLASIVESSDDAIIGKTLDGTIVSWNRGAERMYGYPSTDMVGKPIGLLVPPGEPDELPAIVKRLRRGEDVEQLATKRQRKDGKVIDVLLKISAIRDGRGEFVGSSTIARDVTQLKAQAELERDLDERRALLAHLVAAGEDERSRIAGDIHDDSIQAITAAGMRLQILRRKLEDPEQLELLDDLEQVIQLSIERLRHLLFDLRPPVLDNDGLSAAVEMYLQDAGQGSKIRYELENKLRSQPSSQTRTILYRIIQEALVNVRKHSDATTTTVYLQEREGGYFARVVDDGVGFAADEAKPVAGHLGLAAMRERVTLAGGWIRIESEPGRGTTIEVWMPAVGAGEKPDEATPSGSRMAAQAVGL